VAGEVFAEAALLRRGYGGQVIVLRDDDLVEVGGFVEGFDGLEGGGVGGGEFEGAGEVDFANAESGGAEGVEGGAAVVEFEGEVTGIVVDADAAFDEVGVGGDGEEALEKGEGLGGVFEVAEGFGFEAEVEVLAGLLREGFDVVGAGFEVAEEGGFVGLEFLEGAGEGGDGAAGVGRAEGGDDGEEVVGVGEAFGGGPIGAVDVFLHAGAVEGAVGEAVDGEDVAVLLGEPGLEGGEVVAGEEFGGGLGGEAEADGVGGRGCCLCWLATGTVTPLREGVADGEDVGFEDVPGFRPGFGGVDVGAVGEVVVVGNAHEGDERPRGGGGR